MKIYINSAKENWIVDRFKNEWINYNGKVSRHYLLSNEIIWLMAPWTWKKIPKRILLKNKVLCTIHHIDEEKFNEEEKNNFLERDEYVNHYHAISNKTYNQVKNLTNKPITMIPFWVNQNIWFSISSKNKLKEKYKIDKDAYVVGTFQRDTEGFDLKSPKLSKGPDRLIEIFEKINQRNEKFIVILTGKRRNYLIEQLNKKNINYKYFEMADFKIINELYNILDLYIVASRYEGGPASVLECSITKTPIISTDVGISSDLLHESSIFDMSNFSSAKPNIDYAYENVLKHKIPQGFHEFNKLMVDIYEN